MQIYKIRGKNRACRNAYINSYKELFVNSERFQYNNKGYYFYNTEYYYKYQIGDKVKCTYEKTYFDDNSYEYDVTNIIEKIK